MSYIMRDWRFPLLLLLTSGTIALLPGRPSTAAEKPNIVIVMADDMGWRDTGYAGSPHAKTPHLDDMAAKGLRFDYFYPGQQMCSPGRFATLTGRNPIRTGLHHLGAMRKPEITIAEALKTAGYKTGQFGKWHLGSGETSPAKKGFDTAIWAINYFDLGAKLQVGDSKEFVPLAGDTSVATMNLALDFIRQQAAAKEPFLAYVCFGSPHSPHQAAEEFKALYPDLPEKQQDFYGEISGLDAAVGNLRAELAKLQIADNTILWFTSDNGGITPASQDPAGKGKTNVGVRTVSVLEWPARIREPRVATVPCGHVDIYPTLLDVVGVTMPNQPVVDGQSLVPLFDNRLTARDKPLGFLLWHGKSANLAEVDLATEAQSVWIDGQYKLIVHPTKAAPEGKKREKAAAATGGIELYDIYADLPHKNNLAKDKPEVVAKMQAALATWQKSVHESLVGKDFAKP
ncbi:MAG: sulfatase-like hydrolase/transferase [Pirellulaceae bacterium]|nr:sulfatase-like hydrolase/transferase [Pirellulaceae bacterium]